ncbi:MAG TPA: class I SAM-dependent methyltransferase [Syntrophomonas sp.]|nr:class I SAM-dependent methyltransferase [Syntrophomonas sp.]
MPVKLDGVMETLLITLYVRAKDATSIAPVVNDQKAAEMVERIDYDFSKFDSGVMSYYGVLARAKMMDDQARLFISQNPECVVVSMGCGLDTRFSRVDNGRIQWYNLDFAEVIEQRKQFFDEHPRVQDIPKSALDPNWTQAVKTNGQPLLIISEGMLMYLHEKEVAQVLEILTGGFDSFEAHFDLLYKGLVNKGRMHDTVKKTGAQFNWGVKDGSEVARLCPGLRQIGLINFTDEMRRQLPGAKKLLIPIMYLTNNRLGIYTYKKNA